MTFSLSANSTEAQNKLREKVSNLCSSIVSAMREAEFYCWQDIEVRKIHSSRVNAGDYYLFYRGYNLEVFGEGYLYGDFNLPYSEAPIKIIQQFAEAVNNGLLDDLKQALEDHCQKSQDLAEHLPESL